MGIAIRLVNGSNATEGTVEVCIGGRYGTVCDDHWDVLDARVVCRHHEMARICKEMPRRYRIKERIGELNKL